MATRLACTGLLILIGALFTGCGKAPLPKPAPIRTVTMTDEQRADLDAALAELDASLQAHTPAVHALLAAPATSADIDQLRSHLGGAKRPYLEAWFSWHDGSSQPAALLPLGEPMSVTGAIADRQTLQSIPLVDPHLRRDIKIMQDAAGDGFYLDLAAETPRIYYAMLEDPTPRYFGSLPRFLRFIASVHDAELASVDDHGIVVFDLAAYQAMEDAYLIDLAKAE